MENDIDFKHDKALLDRSSLERCDGQAPERRWQHSLGHLGNDRALMTVGLDTQSQLPFLVSLRPASIAIATHEQPTDSTIL